MRSPRCHSTSPVVGSQRAVDERQERGLARAVGADDGDALACFDAERHTFEHALGTEGDTDVAKADQGQAPLLPCRTLAGDDAPHDGDRRRVRRVHAEVREAASAERAGLRVRRVRCVVDDAEIDAAAWRS